MVDRGFDEAVGELITNNGIIGKEPTIWDVKKLFEEYKVTSSDIKTRVINLVLGGGK